MLVFPAEKEYGEGQQKTETMEVKRFITNRFRHGGKGESRTSGEGSFADQGGAVVERQQEGQGFS